MAFEKKGHPLILGNRDWENLARIEWARRVENRELYQGMDVSAEYAAAEKSTLNRKLAPMLLTGAVEAASLLLLKEFIQRKDKKKGIVKWLAELGLEVFRYGEILREDQDDELWLYTGMEFMFTLREDGQTVLAFIREHNAKNKIREGGDREAPDDDPEASSSDSD